jgi:hypothetical protein
MAVFNTEFKAQKLSSPQIERSKDAQFIVVCSNAKTYEIGENLLSVSNPISSPEGMLIHAEFLIPLPTLQRRYVPCIYP